MYELIAVIISAIIAVVILLSKIVIMAFSGGSKKTGGGRTKKAAPKTQAGMLTSPVYALEPVTKANITELRQIRVLPEQQKFVADIDSSLIQASFLRDWHGFAFKADGVVVGFGAYAAYDKAPVNPAYKIYKMIIDKNHQGKGHGSALLRMLIDAVPTSNLYIDVHTANKTAISIYSKRFDTVSDDGETTIMKLRVGKLTVRARGKPANPAILLIPGLGNGAESFNWNLSTEEQRRAVGVPAPAAIPSLQDKLAEKYYVITFDPPGFGENAAIRVRTLDEYTDLIYAAIPTTPAIIAGHSIGGRVAQWYAARFGGKTLLLDPTPEYILREINYRKHIDNPGVAKYVAAHDYITMAQAAVDKFAGLRADAVIYSIDDVDPEHARKAAYFETFPATEKARLDNATHWVHVSSPARVIEMIEKMAV